MIFEGSLSVKAILENQKRTIVRVIIQEDKHSKDINYILHLCHKHEVKVERVSKEQIDNLAVGKTHGGILIEANSRKSECIDASHDFYFCIEGVEDPYNLGNILRSLGLAGVKSVIINHRDLSAVENIIVKSSAGVSESLNLVYDLEALKTIKENGVKILAANRCNSSVSYTQENYRDKICICIGGEKRGLSKEVLKHVDSHIEIFYSTSYRVALSAIASANILAFEVVRQRSE